MQLAHREALHMDKSDSYHVSFDMIDHSADTSDQLPDVYVFNTLEGSGAKVFRAFLSDNYIKESQILLTEYNNLFSNKDTTHNMQKIADQFGIDLIKMSDQQLFEIGLERTKKDQPRSGTL